MTETAKSFTFGPFQLDLEHRLLLRDGKPVHLPPKALMILCVLVENHGELVERQELMQRVWPNVFVEEGNLSVNVFVLRKALADGLNGVSPIETIPTRGYRFTATVKANDAPAVPAAPADDRSAGVSPSEAQPSCLGTAMGGDGSAQEIPSAGSPVSVAPGRLKGPALAGVAAIGLIGIVAAGAYFYLHSRAPLTLTDKDTVVLAEFSNTTGDPVFDGTLRQGLTAQLEQSPILNLLSDTRISQTLAHMGQPKDARLSPALAREVCQRTASVATLEGSIAMLGSQYVLGLQAVNCHSGELLAVEQERAGSKEGVLYALGAAATKTRQKLGESLASLQKFDAPPEDVTTASVEALQAYSLGYQKEYINGDWAGAVPLFQRATSLDTNFAMAYGRLGTTYFNLGESAHGAENLRKAYALRERVSERERFYIDSHYEQHVTGDLEAARNIYELWAGTYPRDPTPPANLATIYEWLGESDKALAEAREFLRLDPGSGQAYAALAGEHLGLNRLEEAKATAQEARSGNLDSLQLHIDLYAINFLQQDTVGMEREAASVTGTPGYEGEMLLRESDTAAYTGQFAKARELSRRAIDWARRADEKDAAAYYQAEAALREVLVGNTSLARQQAQAALAVSQDRDVAAVSAIAMAMAGDCARATGLGTGLSKRFPKDTLAQYEYLPMIQAAAILGAGNGPKGAAQAIEALAAVRYELGSWTLSFTFYAAYLRGEAYLAAHQGAWAAAEFQKILDHPGLVVNEPIGALAHLGLGRAYAAEAGVDVAGAGVHDMRPKESAHNDDGARHATVQDALAKAHAAYQDFFTLWKDADPDIPILKQARAEYVELQ